MTAAATATATAAAAVPVPVLCQLWIDVVSGRTPGEKQLDAMRRKFEAATEPPSRGPVAAVDVDGARLRALAEIRKRASAVPKGTPAYGKLVDEYVDAYMNTAGASSPRRKRVQKKKPA